MGSGFRGAPLFRYGWRGSVRKFYGAEEPTYVVAEPEWLTLVENSGLGSRVVDQSASGQMRRRDRGYKVKHYVEWALLIIALTAVVIYHFMR